VKGKSGRLRFEFADFELLRERAELAGALCRAQPEAAPLR
jgi:hypothetical protein